MKPRLHKAALLVFIALVFSGCTEEKKPKTENVKPAKVLRIEESREYISRQFSGQVIAAQKATLSFEVNGKLIKLPVLDGSMVNKGDLVAAIDPQLYQEKVKETKAKYELESAQFKRAEKLIKKGFISQSDYDLLKSRKSIAEANFSSAKKNLRDTVLYAPFDGIIVKSYVENYEFIKAKQPIVLLQDLHEVDIEIFVPEYIILQMKKKYDLNPNVIFSQVQRSYPVNLKEFSTQADKNTQTYRAVFTLKAPEDINILPGMSVIIELQLPDFKAHGANYHLIPVSAVFSADTQQAFVWLVNPETLKVHKHKIVTGDLAKESIKVFKGLKKGDMVVTAGVYHLREGQKIKPILSED